jgi:hypothetical protein
MEWGIKDACEEIDAAIFTGDCFVDGHARRELKEYIDRWVREMKNLKQVEKEFILKRKDESCPSTN